MLCISFPSLKPLCILCGLGKQTAVELFQTYMAVLCKCIWFPPETIRNLSIAFVGNWASLQSRTVPVDSSHPLLFLRFISFPEGAVHWSGDGNLELC